MTTQTPSFCGVVDLLAAIFGTNADELRIRYGLLPKGMRACFVCGKLTKNKYRKYCSKECLWEDSHVPLECICGKIFYRRKALVIYHLNHPHPLTGKPQERFFCSQQCKGVYIAKTYGFGIHQNRGDRHRLRKWDYDQVYELQDKTGWGRFKIAYTLGIPRGTVAYILAKRKRA